MKLKSYYIIIDFTNNWQDRDPELKMFLTEIPSYQHTTKVDASKKKKIIKS